jgi:hypothetical protein
MPHLELYGQALDDAFPPLAVPQDELLPDAAEDKDDVVYQSGLKVAEAIRRETADHGRKHRMSPNATTTTTTTTYEPKDKKGSAEGQRRHDQRHNYNKDFEGVALVENEALVDSDEREATLHGPPLGRRRSVWEGLGRSQILELPEAGKNPVSQNLVERSEMPLQCASFQSCQSCAYDLYRPARDLCSDYVAII